MRPTSWVPACIVGPSGTPDHLTVDYWQSYVDQSGALCFVYPDGEEIRRAWIASGMWCSFEIGPYDSDIESTLG